MKRISNVLLTVAMMAGVFGSVGCKKPGEPAAQPEAAPATETPVAQVAAKSDESKAVVATATAAVKLPAPPALRVENPGPAPSRRHVFQRGFWRWDGPRTEYVWVPGHWEETGVYAPYAPPAPRFEDPGYAPSEAYFFVPGYYRWSGVEYVWVFGHWSLRADVGSYYRSEWRYEHGRWEHRCDRWDDRHMAAYERREHERREHERAIHERAERDREMRERAEREREMRGRAEHERAMHERAERDREAREREARERTARQERDHRATQPQPVTPRPHPVQAANGHDKPAGNSGHVPTGGHEKPAASAAPVHKVASVPALKPTAPRPPMIVKAPAAKRS